MSDYVPSPKEIKAYLDQFIVGQDQAKRDMAILGYNHYMRALRDNLESIDDALAKPPKLSGLITGPSGSGKTYMCSKLAEFLDLPILVVDATALSVSGFKGVSIYDLFERYIQEYGNTDKGQYLSRGILYIDEIDKLGGTIETTNNGNWLERLQQSLLTILEGTKFKIKQNSQYQSPWSNTEIDTGTMLIIASGSFNTINVNRSRNASYGIGFTTNHADRDTNLSSPVTREELEEAGFISEFIGRLNVITYTNKLSKKELKSIIMDCGDSYMSQFESLFFMSGSKLKLPDEEIDNIIDKAYGSNYGARYLKSMLFECIQPKLFDLEPCNNFIENHLPLASTPEEEYYAYEDVMVFPGLGDDEDKDKR